MRTKKIFLSILAILIGTIILVLFTTLPARGQEVTPPPDSRCISCHENLYYLHDTGKWFCLCADEMNCKCCHGGNPESFIEDEAHLGMVANPVGNEAAICQECHVENYPARVEKFAAVAGVSSFHPMIAKPTHVLAVAELPVDTHAALDLPARLLDPWRLVGLGALTIALAGIILFGYHCWKVDCMSRNRPQ